jgi:hypothetical protein
MSLPIGSIIMWSGAIDTRPDGWNLCDGGTYAGILTPDLRNKFIYGASADGHVGTEAGVSSHSHTNSETGSSGAHTHSITGGASGASSTAQAYSGGAVGAPSSSHNHGFGQTSSADSAHTHKVPDTDAEDVLPPYVMLYYLIRTE